MNVEHMWIKIESYCIIVGVRTMRITRFSSALLSCSQNLSTGYSNMYCIKIFPSFALIFCYIACM